jgi:hypothetical protein
MGPGAEFSLGPMMSSFLAQSRECYKQNTLKTFNEDEENPVKHRKQYIIIIMFEVTFRWGPLPPPPVT